MLRNMYQIMLFIIITIKGTEEEGVGSNAQDEAWDFIYRCCLFCWMLKMDINSRN